jgi:hypothetical protein
MTDATRTSVAAAFGSSDAIACADCLMLKKEFEKNPGKVLTMNKAGYIIIGLTGTKETLKIGQEYAITLLLSTTVRRWFRPRSEYYLPPFCDARPPTDLPPVRTGHRQPGARFTNV